MPPANAFPMRAEYAPLGHAGKDRQGSAHPRRGAADGGELRQAAGAVAQAPWLSRIEPSRHTADLNVRKYRSVELCGRLYHVAREANFEAKAQGQSGTSVGRRWVVVVAGERSIRSN